ncbi:MAG: hypothetical protein Kow0063_00820 [Anaerolineae bacterium]
MVLPETKVMRSSITRRLVGLLIPCVLAAGLFAVLVWPGLAADFSHYFRLSTSSAADAANPDIATAGDYVAVVWSEGYNPNPDTKEWGHVFLKSADTTNGWNGRVQLLNASEDVWGREPRLAFHPGNPAQVHIVWAQSSGCDGVGTGCQWTSIWHTTCNLATLPDTCAQATQVASGLSDASTPDVAVDASGGVHVVWREGGSSIKYCKKGSCGSPASVGTGQHPSLVFGNNRLHVVWDAGSTIEYRRDDSPDNSSWNPGGSRSWNPATGYEDPGYPAIDARDGAIYVVWAVKKTGTNSYVLAFDFYDGDSSTWRDDSGANIGFTIPGNDPDFENSTAYESNSDVSYLYSLKPDVVVTSTGVATQAYAHLVWHGKETGEGGGAYKVWYSYLEGIDDDEWSPPQEVGTGSTDDAGDPALAVGSALTETHVALMQDADGKAGGTDTLMDIWYVGVNGNRDNDTDTGVWLPIIFKNF